MPNSSYANSQYSVPRIQSKAIRGQGIPIGKTYPKNYINSSVTKATKLKEKSTMKDWLRRKLHAFIFPGDDAKASISTREEELGYQDDHAIRFQVTTARGGIILSMRNYDHRTDRNQYQNYVIPDTEDASAAIAQIVSMELLRNPSS